MVDWGLGFGLGMGLGLDLGFSKEIGARSRSLFARSRV